MTDQTRALAVVVALGALACNSGGETTGGGGSSGTGMGTASSMATTGTGGMHTAGTPVCGGPIATGTEPVATTLPTLPELQNVSACVNGDAVNVTFDALDPAVDYRIYPLPTDGDVTVNPDGSVVVKNAIYRCAGHREALYMLQDQPGVNDNTAGGTTTINGMVEGFARSEADAGLGYVFTTPGPDRVPVYVLGNADPGIEEGTTQCGRPTFYSTRPKTYTTDKAKRDTLIAAHLRDDGIAFYVPAAASASTRIVYEGSIGDGDVLRWIDGAEGTERAGKGEPLFNALTAPADGTAPLMRVHVEPYCSKFHDELVAGMARYNKARVEGDQPLNAVRWSGLTSKTVLVVEALDHGCPYQGNLSPEHQDAFDETFGSETIVHEAYLSLDDMRSASTTSEVFVNGQYEGQPLPKAIARSFLNVEPTAPVAMDFYDTFPAAASLGTLTHLTGDNPPYVVHYQSSGYDVQSYNNSGFHVGTMLGELWFAYNDISADVNGKVRITPHAKGDIGATDYLHVTGEFDVLSTQRRYPQIIISDRDAPVQENLEGGTTIIVQPKDMTPSHVQLQICDHRTWDVNNQCPLLPTFSKDFQPAVTLPGELTGTDNAVKFDVYLSTARIYVMLDDKPYACVELPAKADDGVSYAPPSGPVTVTWGDVLYHSGVDFAGGSGPVMGDSYLFHRTHMQVNTRRHFDNIGFTSHQPAPEWDATLHPCATGM